MPLIVFSVNIQQKFYLLDDPIWHGYLEAREDDSFTIPDPVVEYIAAHL